MVNKIGLVLEKLGFEDLPQTYSFLANTTEIDNLAVTSEVDEELFESFEQIAFENYSENNPIRVYADQAYQDMIKESDKVHDDVVNYFTYENGSPTTQMADLLADTMNERSLVIASKDYIDEFREKVDPELKNDKFTSLYK